MSAIAFLCLKNKQYRAMYRIIIYLSFLPLFVFPQKTSAQTHLCIHYKSGGHSYVSVEQIDCITFVDGNDLPADEVSLTQLWHLTFMQSVFPSNMVRRVPSGACSH